MRVNSVEAFHVINVGLEVCVCSELTKSLKTGRPTQKKAFLENVTQKSCFLSKLWPVNEADSRRFIQRRWWWGGFYGTGWMHRNMTVIRDVLGVESERRDWDGLERWIQGWKNTCWKRKTKEETNAGKAVNITTITHIHTTPTNTASPAAGGINVSQPDWGRAEFLD